MFAVVISADESADMTTPLTSNLQPANHYILFVDIQLLTCITVEFRLQSSVELPPSEILSNYSILGQKNLASVGEKLTDTSVTSC